MNISIFGLGYVGAVTSACLAKVCNNVIGVDPDPHKLSLLRAGKSPIIEDGLDELVGQMVGLGKVVATDDAESAVLGSDLSIVCVGTPSRPNGSLDTTYVEKVCEQIGAAIRKKGTYHSVVIRSTVLPGTTLGLLAPILETASGGTCGEDFGLSMNPEFLREGSSIDDFFSPPFTVIGTEDPAEFERVRRVFTDVPGEFLHVPIPTAEAVKYSCNLFHAVKITFANEVGSLCRAHGIDGRAVLDVVCRDTKLNISPRYLRPGFAFGGSCLPKDLRAFTYAGQHTDTPLPMLASLLESNRGQVDRLAARVMKFGLRKVGLLGLSFKPGTDDLRESPLVALGERLIGRGYDLFIADPNVRYASLHGANKRAIDRDLPHLKRLLRTPAEVVEHAEVLVIGHDTPTIREALAARRPDQSVIDLVGLPPAALVAHSNGDFNGAPAPTPEGIYW